MSLGMKRRLFLQLFGAAGFAPALPTVAVSKPVAAATSVQKAWASYYARVHPVVTVDKLASALKLDRAIADELFDGLLKEKIITGTGGGTATAVNPIWKNMRFPGEVPSNIARSILRPPVQSTGPRISSLRAVVEEPRIDPPPIVEEIMTEGGTVPQGLDGEDISRDQGSQPVSLPQG